MQRSLELFRLNCRKKQRLSHPFGVLTRLVGRAQSVSVSAGSSRRGCEFRPVRASSAVCYHSCMGCVSAASSRLSIVSSSSVFPGFPPRLFGYLLSVVPRDFLISPLRLLRLLLVVGFSLVVGRRLSSKRQQRCSLMVTSVSSSSRSSAAGGGFGWSSFCRLAPRALRVSVFVAGRRRSRRRLYCRRRSPGCRRVSVVLFRATAR